MRTVAVLVAVSLVLGVSTLSLAQSAAKPAAKPAAAAPKGPSADEKAQERAVANYRKNKGMDAKPAAMGAKAPAKKKM